MTTSALFKWNKNVVWVDATASDREMATALIQFLPRLQSIKEKGLARPIPPPRVIVQELRSIRKLQLVPIPQFLSIVQDPSPDEIPEAPAENGRKSRSGKAKQSGPDIE
jgi:hypothetical protein